MSYVSYKKKGSAASPYRDASDSRLIAACLKGEEAAWDTLIDRYAALIFSV